MANQIKIEVLGDVRKIKNSLQNVEGQLGGFGKKMGKIGGLVKGAFVAAGAAVAGAKVADFFKDSIRAASDLEQSTGAVEAVFGKQAGAMKKAAEGAAEAFGLSKNQYQELATVLGAGLKNQGIKDFGGETKKVIGLGADLAAQFGGSTKDAVEAIASLMRGEADPIEQYGVSIKESAISADLAAKGQDKLKGAALEQAKAQARLSLLFKQTTDAQGAFAREGDTLATMQQKNAAAWENLKAKLGTVFLPVMVKVQKFLAEKVLPAVEKLFGWIQDNAPAAIEAVKGFLAGIKGDGTATKYLDYIKQAFATVVPIVRGLVSAIVAAWPAISSALASVFDALKSVFALVQQLWTLFGPQIIAQVTNVFTMVAGVIGGAMQVIAGVIKTISAVMRGDWSGAWQGIQQIVSGQLQIIKSVISGVLTTIDNLMGGKLTALKNFWVNAWNSMKTYVTVGWAAIKTVVSTGIETVKTKISSTINAVKTLWTAGWSYLKTKLSEAWSAIVSTVTTKINDVKGKIRGLKDKIVNVFSGAAGWLKNAGREIIGGLLEGINSRIDQVRTKLRTLTDLIPSWKGPAERDASLLTNAGQLIMESLVKGFDKGEQGVKAKLGEVTKTIQGALDSTMAPTLTPSVSLQAMSGSLSASGALAGPQGGNTYNITVEVPVGTDPAAAGREMVRCIREYERLGGRQ